MAHEWIAAETALRYLTDETYSYAEQRAICERAHGGLIAANASVLFWNGEEHREKRIPKEFWWAEGHEALAQNWETGDFATWIDQKIEVKAFGVSFDFLGISELAPAQRRAVGMQRISVIGDPDWLPAIELRRLLFSKTAIAAAGSTILEASRMGQLVARAVRASGIVDRSGREGGKSDWAAREWDVPLWFWRDFTGPDASSQDWGLGKARGKGRRNNRSETIELQGLHFHKAGLANLGIASDSDATLSSSNAANRGRRPKYDWASATAAVWGRIYRGELIPDNQADIERALQAELAAGDDEPSESTVRPFAKPIWDEFKKD